MAARHFGDGGEDMSDEITQQTLLPGVKLVFFGVFRLLANVSGLLVNHVLRLGIRICGW